MNRFEKFEDIIAWQKAFTVTVEVYRVTNDQSFARDYGLRDQIRRASVSIMANIAEGHERRSNVEFANFLNISRGSAAEVQSHLHIARKLEYVSEDDFSRIYSVLTEISKMTLSLAKYLRQQKPSS